MQGKTQAQKQAAQLGGMVPSFTIECKSADETWNPAQDGRTADVR